MPPETHNTAQATEPSLDAPTQPESPEPEETTTTTVIVIISVLLTQITDEFDSFTSVGWYGSAYLLTCWSLQLIFGKIYRLFSVKWTILWSNLIFEASSALRGAAPISTSLIVGRAICGVGVAGISAGVIQGMFGALMGVSSIVGPLIGGDFASNVTWRWCFYINLPVGFPTGLPPNPLVRKDQATGYPRAILLVPGTVCLFLALQWGGQIHPWSNGRVIALLILTGVLLVGFSAVQVFLPRTATLPPRIFKQRSIVAAKSPATDLFQTRVLTEWSLLPPDLVPVDQRRVSFRVRHSHSPLMISMVAGSISGGTLDAKIGYYTPLAIVGTCLMCAGNGLLTTFEVDTGAGKWIGDRILYGLGLGLSFQVPNLATQASLSKRDVPIGLALMLFATLLGASVFVSAGENVLANQLIKRLAVVKVIDASMITSGGATSLLQSLPDGEHSTALGAYNEALREVFRVGLIQTCLSVPGAASLEWRGVKKPAGEAFAKNGEKETTEKV
ncbi:hypothetical protein CNMCM7691_002785 [Aspergillus felis]|uniref:MFS general substrate transporter n=1 Tax=Aspergillus felis TaxID=1287682 RepID=A0A8H6QRA7_9EURO|nr:hypothetical protein CNMCM7691_002785 [Aspergillus felis]